MLRRLPVTVTFILSFIHCHASHFIGGEIVWEYLGNSEYIFKVNLYRDCGSSAASLPSQVILTSNSPVDTIYCEKDKRGLRNLSPEQCHPNFPSIYCGVAAAGEGAVEYMTYVDTVVLQGTPPPTGWYFSFSNCCRANTINNLANPGYLYLYSVMYPCNVKGNVNNTQPCNNSSPQFLEHAAIVTCAGKEVVYNNMAVDNDGDSLFTRWSYAANPSATPPPPSAIYAANYSHSSPLPGKLVNSYNKDVVLDTISGQMRFKSYSVGSYAVNFKVEEWRDGQLIGKYFREGNIFLIPCQSLAGSCNSQDNGKPSLSINSTQSGTAIQPFVGTYGDTNYYKLTATVGDLIELDIKSYDSDLTYACDSQLIKFTGYGEALAADSLYLDTTKCGTEPCATLTPLNVWFDQYEYTGASLHWQTRDKHINNNPWREGDTLKAEYQFYFKVIDNACLLPEFNYTLLKVVLKKYQPNVSVDDWIAKQVEIYPNPVEDMLVIDTGSEELRFELTDVSGRIVKQGELQHGNNLLNLSEFSRGLYLIRVFENNSSKTFKIEIL